MRISRSIVRVPPSLTRTRVEFVPQSTAPRISAIEVLFTFQLLVHPAPYRVVAASQVPGVVGVQALHTPAGASDAARRTRTGVVGGQRRVALGRVALVGGGQLTGVDRGLGLANPTDRLEAGDLVAELG